MAVRSPSRTQRSLGGEALAAAEERRALDEVFSAIDEELRCLAASARPEEAAKFRAELARVEQSNEAPASR